MSVDMHKIAARAAEYFYGEMAEKFKLFLKMKVVLDPQGFALVCKLLEYDMPAEKVYGILREMFLASVEDEGGLVYPTASSNGIPDELGSPDS